MSTFTEEIKNEIIHSEIADKSCKIAFLSAFMRTSGALFAGDDGIGFELTTESERTAEFVTHTLEELFALTMTVSDAKLDRLNKRDKLSFSCVGENAQAALEVMGILRRDGGVPVQTHSIDEELIKGDRCKAAYVKGAFLGGGSCTLPEEQTYSKTGYHFEVVFPDKAIAGDYCDLLLDFEVLAKLVGRKENAVVYVKSKEQISDLLNAMDTAKCLKKLNKIVEKKDKSNNENRVSNCSVSNIDKAVTASVAQIRAIEVISQTVGLQSLNANLFEVAGARLADPNASMQELADRLKISKSCINHRMRRITEMAAQLLS